MEIITLLIAIIITLSFCVAFLMWGQIQTLKQQNFILHQIEELYKKLAN